MLTVLFVVAAVVLAAAVVRRPRSAWQRIAVALAAILALAVLVAWGIEYVAQRA